MKRFLIAKSFLLLIFFTLSSLHYLKAQAFDFNSFFTGQAITFSAPDSNNMIYDELKNPTDMVNQLDSIFPFYTNEFYGAYAGIQPDDTITFLYGLHDSLPTFDSKASEIKGKFLLNNKTDYWYSYYKKSIRDTTTAIVIFPGFGANESFHIANDNSSDYHNADCLVKEKALMYGDVYIIVKPNEEFRSIWKTVPYYSYYGKLSYDVLTPYTVLLGKSWASNLYIEFLAQLKYLKSRYKKVIVMGLSNGGFPVLVCGLEAGADGVNCASGLSVTSFTGFPVPNNENPFFSGLFDYYSLENIKSRIEESASKILFTYGSGDCCTNAYEYDTHALQSYLNTPAQSCNAEFFYDFSGHTFSCRAIDSFFRKVKASPKSEIQLVPFACSYDSLPILITLTGQSPFAFDLYKDAVFYQHFTSNENIISISVTAGGNYQVMNVIDANNIPLCKSARFSYVKPTLPNITQAEHMGLDCVAHVDSIKITCSGTPPFKIFSDLNGYNGITFQTREFTIAASQGNYSIFSIVDSSGCPNIINFPITVTDDTLTYEIKRTGHCIDNKHLYQFNSNGQPPFQLNYKLNDILYTREIPAQSFEWLVEPGNYYLINITDAKNCGIFINRYDSLNNFLQSTPVLKLENNYLIATKDAYKYDWYKNGLLIDSTNQNKLITQGSGDYYAMLTDSSGCTYNTNSITLSYPSGINIYPNPTGGDLSILIDEIFTGTWNFALYDNTGKLIFTGQNSSAYKLINLHSLSTGIYNILIEYNNGHGEKIRKNNRIIKE
jgi:hypothetical protein